jgi:hypothetical protein
MERQKIVETPPANEIGQRKCVLIIKRKEAA